MKITKAIKKAVDTRNSEMAGRIADVLRFKWEMNYDEIYNKVNSIAPISKPMWEAMMYESESN